MKRYITIGQRVVFKNAKFNLIGGQLLLHRGLKQVPIIGFEIGHTHAADFAAGHQFIKRSASFQMVHQRVWAMQ